MRKPLLPRLADFLRRLLSHPLIQRVIRNTGYLFSAQTISAALSMGQGILAARLLGVEGAGLVGIITQFSSNANQLTSFRMGELVLSFVGEFMARGKPERAAAVFKAAVLVEFIGSALAYGLVLVFARLGAQIFAHEPALAPLFSIYGLSVLASLFAESGEGLLQYFDRFRLIAGITIGQSLLTVGLIAAAFLRGGGLMDVVLAYLAGKVAWGVAISLASLQEARRSWGPGWWKAPLMGLRGRWRDLVRFAVSTNLSGTIKLVTRDSEMLWLGAFSSPLQVGYYKIAKAVSNVVIMPVTPLIRTTYREVAREVADRQWENVRYLLRSGTLIAAAWTLPAALGLILFGRWVVALYGSEFLPTSFDALMILLAGVAAANILYWNQLVLLPLGMPDYPTKVQFVAAIGKVAGTVLLVPIMGAMGMAALLSGFLIFTSGALVWKSLRALRHAELRPVPAAGG